MGWAARMFGEGGGTRIGAGAAEGPLWTEGPLGALGAPLGSAPLRQRLPLPGADQLRVRRPAALATDVVPISRASRGARAEGRRIRQPARPALEQVPPVAHAGSQVEVAVREGLAAPRDRAQRRIGRRIGAGEVRQNVEEIGRRSLVEGDIVDPRLERTVVVLLEPSTAWWAVTRVVAAVAWWRPRVVAAHGGGCLDCCLSTRELVSNRVCSREWRGSGRRRRHQKGWPSARVRVRARVRAHGRGW